MKQRTPYGVLLDMANKVTSLDESISVRQTLNFAIEFCKELGINEAISVHNVLLGKEALIWLSRKENSL